MRKTIAVISAIATGVAGLSAQELSVSTTFGWESEYIFRGAKLADEIYTPSVDLTYGGAYVGIWAALPVDGAFENEIDFYAGYGFQASELLSLDFGATYYTYPEQSDDDFFGDDNSVEFYAGAALEVLLSPALYVYYDIDLDVFTVEGSIGHSIPLTESISFDTGAYLGWVNPDHGDDYTYYGVTGDFVLTINEAASISAGVRWAGASEDYMWSDNPAKGVDDNTFWFGFSFTTGF